MSQMDTSKMDRKPKPTNLGIDTLPQHWQQEVRNLRAENARFRVQRRALQQELERLRAALNNPTF